MPPRTIWRDIADDLRRRVESGEWATGERLPTVRELMEQYDTPSQGALVRAISALSNEGVLITDPAAPRRGVRVRARPRFVRPIDGHFATSGLEAQANRTFEDSTGADDVDVQITFERQPPTDVAELLGDEQVLVRTFRYIVQGTPHMLLQSWMLDSLAEQAGLREPSDEVPGKSTNVWLAEAGRPPRHADLLLYSRLPTEDEVKALAMPTALPVMVRERTLYDHDLIAVETSTTVVVSDQIAYHVRFDLDKES